VSDTLSHTRGTHTWRFGGEFKRHFYDTDLPEEQQTEFEKQRGFTQFLRGLASEGDTQFGTTLKSFRMTDLSWFVADDWKISNNLTINAGLRWDWFGWPTEKNGRIGNVDFTQVGPTLLPNAFIVPKNVRPTGLAPVDAAVATSRIADTDHTLNGQDLNNFQPRIGFAWSPRPEHPARPQPESFRPQPVEDDSPGGERRSGVSLGVLQSPEQRQLRDA
jgi:outer membrane receptor protein involved in Fe transport